MTLDQGEWAALLFVDDPADKRDYMQNFARSSYDELAQMNVKRGGSVTLEPGR